MCDYTLKGLRANVPDAFMSVSMYWVRKAFERSDRYLALYSMETTAMPFALREFMVKCWKRHRDTPTTIDDLVDQAFEDLRAKKTDLVTRMASSNVKVEKLQKVNDLLEDISTAMSDFKDVDMTDALVAIETKIRIAKARDEAAVTKKCASVEKYYALQKNGHLGMKRGSENWDHVESDLPDIRLPATKKSNPLLPLPPTPHTLPHLLIRDLNQMYPPAPTHTHTHNTINRFDDHETVDTTHKLWTDCLETSSKRYPTTPSHTFKSPKKSPCGRQYKGYGGVPALISEPYRLVGFLIGRTVRGVWGDLSQ